MAYVIKRPRTLKLLDHLAADSGQAKIDVIHAALYAFQKARADKPSLWEFTQMHGRALSELGDPDQGHPVDKDFIDSLYEDDSDRR